MDDTHVEDFLPKYPYVDEDGLNQGLKVYSKIPFQKAIYDKKEFNSLRIGKENVLEEGELLFNHQRVVSRFISSHTVYDGILLIHEMGTGKTCAAFGTIEEIRKSDPTFDGAIILTQSPNVLNNLIEMLATECTGGKYLPEKDEMNELVKKSMLSKNQRSVKSLLISKIKNKTRNFYTFNTFGQFAEKVLKLKSTEEIRKLFSNKIIVLDEVHNLKLYGRGDNKSSFVYNQLYRFLHSIQNCKKILMSGTPMTDDAVEIATILNLILPENKTLPTNKDFKEEYMSGNEIKPSMIDKFKKIISGRVSYLKASLSDIKINFHGKIIPPMSHFKVYTSQMSPFQLQTYEKAIKLDEQRSDIFANSEQATLFVFPDSTYGKAGFENPNFIEKKKYAFIMKKDLLTQLKGHTVSDTIKNISKFSSIYAKTIESIINNKDKNTLVFNDLVVGSGCVLFSKLLELCGYSRANGYETTPAPRFAILTSETVPSGSALISTIKDRFNRDDNMTGKFIQVIIFSSFLKEGVSFNNVRSIHIQTPHWNYSLTSQVIARGLRLNSHNALLEVGIEPEVDIYQHVALTGPGILSIDLHKYRKSEEKDISIKRMEHLLKESAVDCPIFYHRNHSQNDFDNNTRKCEYTLCDYRCDGVDTLEIEQDFSTYNLYYSNKEVQEVIKELKKYFLTNFSLDIKKFNSMFPNMPAFQKLFALRKIIAENHVVMNAYGFPSYIKENNDTIFLTENLNTDNDYLSASYTEYPVAINKNNFSTSVEKVIINKLLKTIKDTKSYHEFSDAMQILDVRYQRIFLEQALTSPETEKIKMVLTFFKGKYDDKKDYYAIGDDAFEYKDGKWEETDLRVAKSDITAPNPYGIVGEYNPETKNFWIKFLPKGEKTDTRTKEPGKECKNFNEIDLAMICVNMQIPYDTSATENMTKDQIWKILQEQYPKYHANFQYSDTVERLRSAYFFITQKGKRPFLCTAIHNFLKERGLSDEHSSRLPGYGAKKKTL